MTTDEAKNVLTQAKNRLGRKYKSSIRQAWVTGNYRLEGLDDLSGKLQNIRNKYGPSWLQRNKG